MNYTDVFGENTVPPSQQSYSAYPLTANVQAYWPDNYSGSGLVLSNIVEVTSTDVYAITMPSAAEVSVGREVLIRNKGAFTITVLKNGGAALTSIAAGQATLVYVTDNSTAAGVWEQVLYGVGAASVDATSLIGYGIKAISTSLNQAHPVLTTVSSYLITVTDRAKVIVFAGGTASILLPSVSSIGNDFFFLLRNGGTGALTIDPNGSDTVDGLSVLTINPGESLIICSSGSEWFTIGYGRATEFNFTQLTKDVTAGGTIVLTAAEVANKLLTFVGSPTADLTVIVPNTVQVYYVYNNISTIYTITIKTAVGQGVRVFSTARLIVFCDSIDVVSAQAITSPSPSLSLQEQQVATDGQTVVAVPWAYVVGENQLRVYLNGLLQEPVDAYTESNSTTITFTEPLVAGWQILLVYTGGVTDVATFAGQLALPGTETGAELIGYLSAGDLSSATVQDALNELDTEKAALADLAAPTGSELVGYLPAGVGASTDRTVQDKLRESVSVKDFGAVGDGIADDTVAIQAAIDSGAKTIYFPVGTYTIGGSVAQDGYAFTLTSVDGLSFVGDGQATILCKTGLTTWFSPFLFVSCSGITFSGLRFNGDAFDYYDDNPTTTIQNGYYCFNFRACEYITITECDFTGFYESCIRVQRLEAGAGVSSKVKINNNFFHELGNTGVAMLYTEFSSVTDNIFKDVGQTVLIDYGGGVYGGGGLGVDASTGCTRITVSNNIVDGASAGFKLESGANNSIISNNSIANLYTYTGLGAMQTQWYGIRVNGDNNQVVGNTIRSNMTAIVLPLGSGYCKVSGNQILSTSVATASGIYLEGGNGHLISGNIISSAAYYGVLSAASNSRFSDNIVSGSAVEGMRFYACSNISVSQNNVFDNTGIGIWLSDLGGVVDYAFVSGNICYDTRAGGSRTQTVAVFASSATNSVVFNNYGFNNTSNNLGANGYLEGSFTPIVEGTTITGSATYSTRTGQYVKVGNLVMFTIRLTWTGHTGTGNMRISGLPFTVGALTSGYVACFTSDLTLTGQMFVAAIAGQTYMNAYAMNNGSFALLTMDAAATVNITGHYYIT